MTRYIIIGAGAIGATLAAQLHDTGLDHVLVGRGTNIEAIRNAGLRYVQHGRERVVRVVAANGPSEVRLTADDVLVFATKAQDLEVATRDWAWQPADFGGREGLAAELPVVTLQNGLAADRIALRRFGAVLGGSLLTPAQHLEPGQVRSGARDAIGVLTLGVATKGEDPRLAAILASIAADLRRARYIVQTTSDVSRWQRAKLLHSVRNGLEVFASTTDEVTLLGDLLVAEVRAVFGAAGLDVADTAAERTEDVSAFGQDPDSGIPRGQQSTWQSFSRGASSEIDYLNGEVVLLGRLHGVATPFSTAVQHVLGGSSLRGERPGTRTVAEVHDHVARSLAGRSATAASPAATLTGALR